MQESEIIKLIVLQLQGAISEDDLRKLRGWFDCSTENQQLYRDICLLYQARQIEQGKQRFVEDRDEMWSRIERRIRQTSNTSKSKGNRAYLLPYLRYAAVIVVALLLGWLGKDMFTHTLPNKMITVSVPNGSLSNITLPDGSKVWLNSGSSLSYSTKFGDKERRLSLDGEGFFNVSHDKKRPFIVTSGSTSIRVLGTKFDMKAYSGDPCQRITLVEGSLRVERTEGEHQVMKPGDQVLISQKQMRLNRVATTDFTAWVDVDSKASQVNASNNQGLPVPIKPYNQGIKSLVFANEPLEQIVRDLGRAFNVDIRIEGNISKEVYYGDFRNGENLLEILDIIASSAHVRYRVKGEQIIIYK